MKKKSLPAGLKPETTADLKKTIEELSKPTPQPKPTKSTFQLTERGYERLNEVASDWGVSVGALLGLVSAASKNLSSEIITNLRLNEPIQGKRIRRSYTVAKQTLDEFQAIQAQVDMFEFKITRDDFIESMTNFFWETSEKSKKERKEALKRAREVYWKMREEWSDGVSKMGVVLSCDHAVFNRLDLIDIIMDNLDMDIESEIEGKGPVDPRA